MDISGCDLVERETVCQGFESDFHKLSHDLRTPLNYINGFAELLLLDGELSPRNAEYVRAILSGGDTLTATVTALLDRAEERPTVPTPVLKAAAPRRRFAGAKAALRHPIFDRARHWGSLRKSRGMEQSAL